MHVHVLTEGGKTSPVRTLCYYPSDSQSGKALGRWMWEIQPNALALFILI